MEKEMCFCECFPEERPDKDIVFCRIKKVVIQKDGNEELSL